MYFVYKKIQKNPKVCGGKLLLYWLIWHVMTLLIW